MYVYDLSVMYPSTVVTKLAATELPRASIALHQGAKFPARVPPTRPRGICPAPSRPVGLSVSASVSVCLALHFWHCGWHPASEGAPCRSLSAARSVPREQVFRTSSSATPWKKHPAHRSAPETRPRASAAPAANLRPSSANSSELLAPT